MAFHRIEFTWFHYSITCTYFLLHLSSHGSANHGDGRYPLCLPSGVRTFLLLVKDGDKAACWRKDTLTFVKVLKPQVYKVVSVLLCAIQPYDCQPYKQFPTFNISLAADGMVNI
jgi:hypothetical protein